MRPTSGGALILPYAGAEKSAGMGNRSGSLRSRTGLLSTAQGNSRVAPDLSLHNLPRINQRREVQADNIHLLKLGFAPELNHGANDSILDLPVVEVHAGFVADPKFALWLLGWHARNVRRGSVFKRRRERTSVPMFIRRVQGKYLDCRSERRQLAAFSTGLTRLSLDDKCI